MDFLLKILTPIIDKFKMKNPLAFTVVVLILLVGSFGIETVLEQEVCTITDGVETCKDLVTGTGAALLSKIKWVFISLAGLLGAHTPPINPVVPVNNNK
jgi:hypothetical protein